MRAVVMSGIVAAMAMVATAAQAAPATRQEVKVPFAFTVNGEEMPAGTYSVRQDDSDNAVLLIEGATTSTWVLTSPVERTSAPKDTSLVFTKIGGRYRLAEVWDGGDGAAIVGENK
jgi:hypothetical protein